MYIIAYGSIEDVQRKYLGVPDPLNKLNTYCVVRVWTPPDNFYYEIEGLDYCMTFDEAMIFAGDLQIVDTANDIESKLEEL